MRIRRAHIGDASELAAVHVDSWKTTYPGLLPDSVIEDLDVAGRTLQWLEWLERPAEGLFIYVAETDDRMQGFIACGPSRDFPECDGEVYAIYLRSEAQRKGIGRRLMATAAARLRNSGAHSMGLLVLANNPARGFYEAMGGRAEGEREGVVRGHSCMEAVYIWDDVARLCETTPHWSDYGEGESAVVFVHGWTCDGDYWESQVKALQKNCRVITLDLPGNGASPAAKRDYSIDLFAQTVADVMDRAQVNSAILVGHSMGGFVVRRCAQLWPQRVSALVAIDAPFALAGTQYFEDKARAFEANEGRAARHRTIEKMFSPSAPDLLKEQVLASMMATPDHEAAQMFRTMSHPEMAGESALPLPVLALSASGKGMGDADSLLRMFPHSRLQRLDCGHFVALERPQEVNQLLQEFIDSILKRRSTANHATVGL